MVRKRPETQLHFVGIGGIGMSGIAEVFLNQGYRVSGSDVAESEITRRLAGLGARIEIGHRAENVSGANVVVVSSAIRPTNPEVIEARRLRVPVIPRAEMLGELMRGKVGVAVAGTHGKTTTTSMLATILASAGMDPTIVVGGRVDSLGGNAKLGHGQTVVAEADESDGSFLHLPATYAVVTNIDNDHLDYFHNLAAIDSAFVAFVSKLPFYGAAAVCGEDPGVRRCLGRWTKPVVTYGLSPQWDVFAQALRGDGFGSEFEVLARESTSGPHRSLGVFGVKVPGEHNVLNALAAITFSRELELSSDVIRKGLAEFSGVRRRFDIRWRSEESRQLIVDDYGHHPTEIIATLAAARRAWNGRILTVFQPHRFSRTLHCRDGFVAAFRGTDLLLVTDIYAASEDPIEGVTAEALAADIRRGTPGRPEVVYVGDLAAAKTRVLSELRPGDLVLCLGAGSITRLSEDLAKELSRGSRPA
jgi:UDP-N-acetylmuramate--alanine ligase